MTSQPFPAALLPAPARYRPYANGRYDVAPGLRPLATPFGNGEVDGKALQIDREFPEFRANKLRCLADRPGKYEGAVDLTSQVAAAAIGFLVNRATEEYPELFHLEPTPTGRSLRCRLTGEAIDLEPEAMLADHATGIKTAAATINHQPSTITPTLHALSRQLQEDVVVVSTSPERGNWLSAYQVCAPSHWWPERKAGHDFSAIHAAVPGMEAVNRVGAAMAEAMVHHGPFVRFVWGFETHRGLNRHPEPPPDIPPGAWESPPFDPASPSPFIVRVERQVTWGLPEVGAALFLIRTYRYEAETLAAEERQWLRSGVLSMSPESRVYKGIAAHWEQLVAWLQRGA